MGDRTSVTLIFQTEHENAVMKIYGRRDASPYVLAPGIGAPNLSCLDFDEVNYGELWYLDQLREAGIAYESHWGNGSGYSAGKSICRYDDDGRYIVIDTCETPFIPLYLLKNLLATPDTVIPYIEATIAAHTYLPWDNQIQNGKRYRTWLLINPSIPQALPAPL